jgi:uncharacterized membrane protein (UPF0182 family)
MYVEPIYLRASSNSMPEVKRVIIYYNGRIAYEKTLAEALESMFGAKLEDAGKPPIVPPAIDQEPEPPKPEPPAGETGPGDTGSVMTQDELITAAQNAFDRGERALRAGDWAEYGAAQDELAEILAALASSIG